MALSKINNEKARMLFDSGAEVSIVDTTFARKLECVIDKVKGKSELELEKTFML